MKGTGVLSAKNEEGDWFVSACKYVSLFNCPGNKKIPRNKRGTLKTNCKFTAIP